MVNIAIFASGNGSNAENIIAYFKNIQQVNVAIIVCNNPNAFVLQRAANNGIPALNISKNDLLNNNDVLRKLGEHNVDFIVLAGFLLLIPLYLIDSFPYKIINLHPALLPKFGGKGMYGMHVHKAVIDKGEKESGISIHYVNQHYDEGRVFAQHKCAVSKSDNPESLAKKIHLLEYKYYPLEIEKVVKKTEP